MVGAGAGGHYPDRLKLSSAVLAGILVFIAPFIGKYDDRNPLASFKQHFDYLGHLAPDEDGVSSASACPLSIR